MFRIVDQRIPFLQDSPEQISKTWFLSLQELYRAVGAIGSGDDLSSVSPVSVTTDIVNALVESAIQSLAQSPVFVPADVVEQLQAEVLELRSLVFELTKSVEALQQGTVA